MTRYMIRSITDGKWRDISYEAYVDFSKRVKGIGNGVKLAIIEEPECECGSTDTLATSFTIQAGDACYLLENGTLSKLPPNPPS